MSALIPIPPRKLARVALLAAAWPFLAVLGLVVAIAGAWRFALKLRRGMEARQDTLFCPRGHANETVGRWSCDRCGGEYLGWLGACKNCGDESVDWFPCDRCGLAVKLPWRSRP